MLADQDVGQLDELALVEAITKSTGKPSPPGSAGGVSGMTRTPLGLARRARGRPPSGAGWWSSSARSTAW